MNNTVGKYIDLKTVVSYFLDEHDKSSGDFDKAWVIAFRALVDLNFDIAAEPVSVRLPVEDNKTVILPPDYLSWTKIGILNNLGEVSTLKINNGLSIFKDNNPDRLSYLTPDVSTTFNLILGIPFFLNFFDNGLYYNLYGVGGGLVQYGGCRVDERHNCIVLDMDFQYDHVILEYISSPQKNGDYKVEMALQEAIIAFIMWKFKLAPPEQYYAEAIKARRRLPGKKVELQHVAQVLRENNGYYLRS